MRTTGLDSRARRPAVIRGSESPPDSHSLPLQLQIPPPYNAKTPPKNRGCSRMVRMTGFEPTRISSLEPETSASAVPPHPHFLVFVLYFYTGRTPEAVLTLRINLTFQHTPHIGFATSLKTNPRCIIP